MTGDESRALNVLFLCDQGAVQAPLAEALAHHLGGDAVRAWSAGVTRGTEDPQTRQVLSEAGIPEETGPCRTLDDLADRAFDVVVTLTEGALDFCCDTAASDDDDGPWTKSPLFVGAPVYLHWPVPLGRDEGLDAVRRARDTIGQHVEAFLAHGYAEALVRQRSFLNGFLDGLEDGVVVHDSERRIFLFNRAAREMTGMTTADILGRDCHDVFQPHGLCGGECRMGGDYELPLERQEYTLAHRTPQGQDRRIQVVSRSVSLGPDRKPGVLATLRDVTEVSDLRWRLERRQSFHGIVGTAPAMQEVFEIIRQVSTSDYPVLVTGESGTGKELVAAAIHGESQRKGGPFVPINCGALPENILESELFGHVRGAFTGAIRDKKGRFELAHGGTIFFDEVGELSPAFQVKLLRVLEEKRFELVGSERTVEVDVRVVSATNRNLRQMVADGDFREDLYYRLAVVPIFLPPLRERRADIPLVAERVLEDVRQETGKDIERIADQAMTCFLSYRWPGNVRELINALQFAAVRCTGRVIEISHLPPEVVCGEEGAEPLPAQAAGRKPGRKAKLNEVAVRNALLAAGGNKVKAAKILGVGRATLYRFLNEHPVSI